MFYRQKNRKCLVLFVTITCLVCIYYFLLSENINVEYEAEFIYDCPDNKSFLTSKYVCFEEPRVFFVETSGSSTLNVRQACAIESTARHNPSMNIYALMTPSSSIAYNDSLIKKLINIPNIHLIRINIDVLVYGSPIFKWYREKKWQKSQWKVSHMSDALRYVLIWKFGGIYLDMDVVTLRSLHHLKNTAITEDWEYVAAGILIFDKNHELIKRCVYDFGNNYNPYDFSYNGPIIVTENIRRYCDVKDIRKVSGSNCSVNILPPEAAFPITFRKWKEFFVPTNVTNISVVFNTSYMIHVWNKMSANFKLKIGTNSLYELAIKQNCPIAYEYAQKIGYM